MKKKKQSLQSMGGSACLKAKGKEFYSEIGKKGGYARAVKERAMRKRLKTLENASLVQK
jgi:general stress protein YciG